MFNKTRIITASIFLSTLIYTGCTNTAVDAKPVTNGYVIKGLIQNALVCIDTNENHSCDVNETSTRTNDKGFYSFEEKYSDPILVVLDKKSFDLSLQKSYDLKLYASESNDTRRDVTMFTTLVASLVKDQNKTLAEAEAIVSDKFDINTTNATGNFANSYDLNQTEKNQIESASGYVYQLLDRTYQSINSVSDTNLSLSSTSTEAIAALTKTVADGNITVVNLDNNVSIIKIIVDGVISNISDTIINDSNSTDSAVKVDAKAANNANDSIFVNYEVKDVPLNQEAVYQALYAVPHSVDGGVYINNFKIDAYDNNITQGDRNITASFLLNSVSYSSTVLSFDGSVYGKKLENDLAVGIVFNANLGDKNINTGDWFAVSQPGVNSAVVEYWGLADAKTICDTNDSVLIDSVRTINLNPLVCE